MGPPVTNDETELMFAYWLKSGRNMAKTQRKFDRHLSTIRRQRKLHNWEQRADDVEAAQKAAVEKAAADRAVSDLQMVSGLQEQLYAKLQKLLNGKGTDFISVAAFAQLTRLKLEISGDLPSDTGGSNIHGDVIQIVQQLGQTDKEDIDSSTASIVEQLRNSKNPRLRDNIQS